MRAQSVEQQITEQARVHGIPEEKVIERILLDRIAIKRSIESEDIAEVVLFLCRDTAWSMTGAMLTMDAGRLAY